MEDQEALVDQLEAPSEVQEAWEDQPYYLAQQELEELEEDDSPEEEQMKVEHSLSEESVVGEALEDDQLEVQVGHQIYSHCLEAWEAEEKMDHQIYYYVLQEE